MEKEFDLLKLWEVLKKHWALIVMLPILAALITGGVSLYILMPVYQASTTLIVGKKAMDVTNQQAGQLLDYNVLMANQQLAKTYGTIAKSRTVEESVIEQLGLGMTSDELDAKVSVNLVKNTEILEISVEDHDPHLAADIANMIAVKFSDAVIQIKKVDSISIVDKAVSPQHPIKPNTLINVFIAFLGGLAFSVALSLLFELLDKTLKNSKDVEDILGLPVLGIIPCYDAKQA